MTTAQFHTVNNMSVMPFCHQQVVCTRQVCALSTQIIMWSQTDLCTYRAGLYSKKKKIIIIIMLIIIITIMIIIIIINNNNNYNYDAPLQKNTNYRLITAYLLLRVNLDKIMHARWDFDASSARTRRVSALDKHQNWSASALFCLNSQALSK